MRIFDFAALGIATIIFLGGCKEKKETVTPAPPVKVRVLVVDESQMAGGKSYTGIVNAKTNTMVSFAVAGTITELYAQEGQKVTKGQPLGKVRNADYVNSNNIAEAELAEARDAFERLKKLHDANALPDVKWVEIQQKLKQAENAAEISSRALGDATLRSPVTGVVTRRIADIGQNVMPVEPVYEIISNEDLTLDISVPEEEIGKISTGETVIVTCEEGGLDAVECKVTMKSVTADPLTRGYTVKIAVPSNGGKLLSGMLGKAVFPGSIAKELEESGKPTVNLPVRSVLLDFENKNFVWVVKNGKAERRDVSADELVPSGVNVTSGLLPGDSVIVEGMQKVSTGTIVICDK